MRIYKFVEYFDRRMKDINEGRRTKMAQINKVIKKKRVYHIPCKYYRDKKNFLNQFMQKRSVVETNSSSESDGYIESTFSTNTESYYDLNEVPSNIVQTINTKTNIPNIFDDIKQWALVYKVKQNAISALLRILRIRHKHNLPKDSRTLLGTSRHISIENIFGGQLWYHGIKNCLENSVFSKWNQNITIPVNISVDGLPLYRSSNIQFWPILMNVHNMPEIKPMVIAIFQGPSKPLSVEEYLRKFVNEFNDIQRNGVKMQSGVIIKIKINAFIADAPARSLLKCIYFSFVFLY